MNKANTNTCKNVGIETCQKLRIISHLEVDFDSILRPFFERKRLGLVLELFQITREIKSELLAWSLELAFVHANRHDDRGLVDVSAVLRGVESACV